MQNLEVNQEELSESPQTESYSLVGVLQDVIWGHKIVVTTKMFPVSH